MQGHVQVATFLQDPECADEAARHLAAAIRSNLRSSIRASTALSHLPAVDPPAPTALPSHASTAALASLPPLEAATVLRHLHPLEVCHLPEPHRSAAVDAYAAPGTPVHLDAPLQSPPSPMPPGWEDRCQSVLCCLRHKPVATLTLPHIGRVSAAYLRDIVPAVSTLSVRSTHAAPILSFLPTATSLTCLEIAFQHAPRASLLDSLLGLSNLRRLSLRLSTLSAEDSARVTSLARLASAAVGDPLAPGAPPTSLRLPTVSHATLVATGHADTPASAWPAQLASLLDVVHLQTLTCVPPRLTSGHPLLRHGSRAPARLAALTMTDSGTDGASPGVAGATGFAAAEAALAASAAAGGWAPLTQLALQPMQHAAELLQHLPHLQDLSLTCVSSHQVPMLTGMLPGLRDLQALSVSIAPDDSAALPPQNTPTRAELCALLCALLPLPLTRLRLSGSPPAQEVVSQLGTLTGLLHLEWALAPQSLWCETDVGRGDGATAAMLRNCTRLTALTLPAPRLPPHPAGMSAALAALPQLQHLELHIHRGAGDPTPQAGAPPAEEPLALPGLRCLTVVFADASDAVHQLATLCWDLPGLTRLHIKAPDEAPASCGLRTLRRASLGADDVPSRHCASSLCCSVEPLLRRVPLLQDLVLPPGTLATAADVHALGPALQRLTRLERLVACGHPGLVADALLPHVRRLPLGWGVW